MSLNYRVGLLIAGLFFVSGAASVSVDRLVILPSFHTLERLEAERNTGRAVEAIHHELHVLSTNATSWAWRDEVRRLVQQPDPGFVERILSDESVASAGVSYIGFYRRDGGQIAHRAPRVGEDAPRLGRFQAASLPRRHPLLRHASPRADATGLVSTPSGPMLVASRPILSSDGSGPGAGVLIFGRLLDEGAIAQIADRYKLDVSVAPATSAPPLEPSAGPPADWKPGEPRRATSVRVDDSGRDLIGQTMIADLHGDPIMALFVRTPRAISARGEEASRIALAILGGVGLAVLVVLLALVHRTVLAPIARLTGHALALGRDDATSARLDLDRRDEIGVLAAEFDRMTDRLAEVRQRLVDQSFVSGKADMAAGILHNLGNAVTPIAVRINTIRDRIKAASSEDLERAIRELEETSTPTERRRDLARFVELASGDLSELLRSIDGDLARSAEQIDHVQQILSEQERYSRAGGDTAAEVVDLDSLTRSVADDLAPDLRRAFELVVEPGADADLAVAGRRVLVRQILGNLILNAAESIRSVRGAGGRIVVRGAPEEDGERDFVHWTIRDDGAGIAAEDLPRIFDRQFSTKERGSGLGLHWTATAVGSMGGRLYAESPGPGEGATLHLVLPRAGHSAGESPPAVRREES